MARTLAFILAGLGVAGLVSACVLTLLDVTLRYWGISILSLSEFVLLLITASVATFMPLSLHEEGQLSIRYLGKAMGKSARYVLDAFGSFATLVFFGLIAWHFILYAIDTLQSGETTAMAALPIYPAWMIAAAVLVIAAGIQCWLLARRLRNDGDAQLSCEQTHDAAPK